MKRPRLIWDDRTPACLPDWAEEELVRNRLRIVEMLELLSEWRLLGDLPGGGYNGTLKERTDAQFRLTHHIAPRFV